MTRIPNKENYHFRVIDNFNDFVSHSSSYKSFLFILQGNHLSGDTWLFFFCAVAHIGIEKYVTFTTNATYYKQRD